MPTVRQLEYLVAVVDLGSFTAAATALHVTQPALSHQMAALERAVGTRLLDRLPRSVRLTPAGRAVLPHARAAIAEANRVTSAARRAAGLTGGDLQIGAVYSVSVGILPGPLRSWRRDHPEVGLRLLEYRHGDELAEAMRHGAADVGVGPAPPTWDGYVRPLGDEEFLVLLPPDDPLPLDGPSIQLIRLSDREWVHYAPGHGLADLLDRACAAAAGFIPRAAVRVEQTATAPLLASAGMGPALVPASLVPPKFDGHVLRADPPIKRPLVAYSSLSPDPVTALFIDALADKAQLLPPHVARLLTT
jgi:DNA-binding transcriptional LysR family regulator